MRRGALRAAASPGGNTICLVACQGVSGLQPSHTCHESKIPTQHKTAALQYIRSLLSRAVSPNESHKATSQASAESRMVAGYFTGLQHSERIHSITFIPQLRSQVGHVLHLPQLWQLAKESRLFEMHCSSQAMMLTSNQWEQRGNISRGGRL